jgi:hypothetical protein
MQFVGDCSQRKHVRRCIASGDPRVKDLRGED